MRKADPEKIGWAGYVANPIRCRCRHRCEYCYMKGMYRRFPDKWPVKPRWVATEFAGIKDKCPRHIWFGSSTDVFGDWVPAFLIEHIILACRDYPQHTYYFLTKNPTRYAEFDFPENCWLGTTVDVADLEESRARYDDLGAAPCAHRFWSVEPMLGAITCPKFMRPDWIIIGADSRKGVAVPEQKWVDDLVRSAEGFNLPVYIKHNLAAHYPDAPWANRREKP